jgi:GNAT superfamily N-acetyltransferase
MAWRQTNAEVKEASGPARKKQMLGRIDAGVAVGLVGYAHGEPLAWVSIAPRDTYRPLGGPEAEPGENVWSIVCMYARRALRRQGLAHQMIAAAVEYARANGATAVEAYPVDPESPSYRHMGFVPAYARQGFREIGRAGTRRHVMRLTLSRR